MSLILLIYMSGVIVVLFAITNFCFSPNTFLHPRQFSSQGLLSKHISVQTKFADHPSGVARLNTSVFHLGEFGVIRHRGQLQLCLQSHFGRQSGVSRNMFQSLLCDFGFRKCMSHIVVFDDSGFHKKRWQS